MKITTQEVIERGWTPYMVRKLLRPDGVEQYCANGWDVTRHLYEVRKVAAAERSNAFKAAKARSEKIALTRTTEAAESQLEVIRAFEEKYGTVERALPDACEAMFNFNRYAKHDTCPRFETNEIYQLKYGLIRCLYSAGYCVGCAEHQMPGKICYKCNGSGDEEACDFESQYMGKCYKCGGSGWHCKPSALIMFRFVVAEVPYCWHVPSENVAFSYSLTSKCLPWEESSEEKPVALAPSKFTEAKALVRWVISRIERSIGVGTFGDVNVAA